MPDNPISNSTLHHAIIKFIIERGYAPEIDELSQLLQVEADEIADGLRRLQDDHGIVLHPDSSRIWIIHPFSLAPTNFLVRSHDQEWWGNCAWCSLGVAALLDRDVTITTTLGANDKQVEVHIRDGELLATGLYVHFPIPMRHAWDNVVYTCSTMLLFEDESRIEEWSAKHRIRRGDVQPIKKVWEFSKVWYGNHLSPEWKKWTAAEARTIFEQFGLTGEIWEIPVSTSRF